MKKQKFSLQLRKQKVAKLSKKHLQGGAINTFTFPINSIHNICLTLQVNCKSVLIPCDPMPTMPSGCGCPTTHTQTTNQPTFFTC